LCFSRVDLLLILDCFVLRNRKLSSTVSCERLRYAGDRCRSASGAAPREGHTQTHAPGHFTHDPSSCHATLRLSYEIFVARTRDMTRLAEGEPRSFCIAPSLGTVSNHFVVARQESAPLSFSLLVFGFRHSALPFVHETELTDNDHGRKQQRSAAWR
jgi:hypothetical protein